jgi:hypothetical protein
VSAKVLGVLRIHYLVHPRSAPFNRDDSWSAKGDVDGRYSSESYRQLPRA